jgi:glycosyltransferase involved in cell wall biosynthesis
VRIGLVSKWVASGQAVVARQIRSALDELGHETFVLARPGSGPRAKQAAEGKQDPVWDQPGVTQGSAHEIPTVEYELWAEDNGLEQILFDENYQWDAVGALRAQGIRTVGRFVWEYFADEHVEPARRAYDTIYSLTRAERDRYAEMGIESPYVQWGIHPELFTPPNEELTPLPSGNTAQAGQSGREAEHLAGVILPSGGVTFYFPGSFLGRRKPIRKVIKAFGKAEGEHLRLLINAQVPRNDEALREAAEADPRIELMLADEPEAIHRARFAACDVCLAPSRWEGLGLPLYEATAFGLPIITNDRPPMSEMVIDGTSGILVPSVQNGTARSGIPAWDPEIGALATAIERLGDRAELERMRAGVEELRAQRNWSRTVADLESLITT